MRYPTTGLLTSFWRTWPQEQWTWPFPPSRCQRGPRSPLSLRTYSSPTARRGCYTPRGCNSRFGESSRQTDIFILLVKLLTTPIWVQYGSMSQVENWRCIIGIGSGELDMLKMFRVIYQFRRKRQALLWMKILCIIHKFWRPHLDSYAE